MKNIIVTMAVISLLTGCRPPSVSDLPGGPVTTRGTTGGAMATPAPAVATHDPVVEVSGETLTRAQLDTQVERLLAMVPDRDRLPPERLTALRQRATMEIIDQYVTKTVLRQEADRRKITISKEDEEAALKEALARLPAGTPLQTMMKNDPQMREEFTAGIKMKKLLREVAEPTEQEVTDFCMKIPESVRARHVLVKVEPSDNEATKKEKRKKIDDIREQIAKGADFGEIARTHSDCGSKQNGGDLGLFQRNQMVKPFEDAAFSQGTNVLGPVVETPFGYHVIEVLQHIRTGEYPRDEAKRKIFQEKAKQFVDSLARKAGVKIAGFPTPGLPSRSQKRPPTMRPPSAPPAMMKTMPGSRGAAPQPPAATNVSGAR